jgi:hypothetical protein
VLSKALQDLADMLDGAANVAAQDTEPTALTPAAVKAIAAALYDAANQARALECQVVPPAARDAVEAGGNVVAFRRSKAHGGNAA